MPGHVFVVLSSAVEGREEEYSTWYQTVHIPEVLQLDGFVRGQFFNLEGDGPHQHMTIYNIPEGQLRIAQKSIARAMEKSQDDLRAGREPMMRISETMGPSRLSYWFTEASDAGQPATASET